MVQYILMKKIYLFLFLIFLSLPAFSQSQESSFSIIGVKSQVSQTNPELLVITVYFNDFIDQTSIAQQNIYLNDKPLSNSKILFSKRGRTFSFVIHNTQQTFSLRFAKIKSKEGQSISEIELSDFSQNTFWKYSKELGKWQKS